MKAKKNPPKGKVLISIDEVDRILPNGVRFSDIGLPDPKDWTSDDGTVYVLFSPSQAVKLLNLKER